MANNHKDLPDEITKAKMGEFILKGVVTFIPFRVYDPRYRSIASYNQEIYIRNNEGNYLRFKVPPLVKECLG